MKGLYGTVLVLIGLAAVTAYLTLFTVHQTQQAMVLEFGKPKRVITEPGLNWKIPFIQNVVYFDKRILELDSPPQEIIASDRKRLVVDAFARYRIVDPLLYYQRVRDTRVARSRLTARLNSALRSILGKSTFKDLVRDRREELMKKITLEVDDKARELGLKIVDIRIKRADLPEANSQAIYRRMQTERQREAAEFRARGEEEARRIRARAEKEVTVIKAEAMRKAEQIRGDGDAIRNKIFAEAFGKDPEFFAFYRAMQAYERGLAADNTRMLISPDSEFFRFFVNPSGQGAQASPNRQ